MGRLNIRPGMNDDGCATLVNAENNDYMIVFYEQVPRGVGGKNSGLYLNGLKVRNRSVRLVDPNPLRMRPIFYMEEKAFDSFRNLSLRREV